MSANQEENNILIEKRAKDLNRHFKEEKNLKELINIKKDSAA